MKRAEEHITQEEPATAAGVSRQTIYAIKHSWYGPSLELALELMHYFGCSIEELFTSKFNG